MFKLKELTCPAGCIKLGQEEMKYVEGGAYANPSKCKLLYSNLGVSSNTSVALIESKITKQPGIVTMWMFSLEGNFNGGLDVSQGANNLVKKNARKIASEILKAYNSNVGINASFTTGGVTIPEYHGPTGIRFVAC